MEILGKVTHRLERKGGISKSGNEWASIDFVIQYDLDQQYQKSVVLTFFGAESVDKAIHDLRKDTEATFYFDCDAHEYNGRWYNSLRCYKFEVSGSVTVHQPTTQPTVPAPAQMQDDNDDLPF